MSDPVTRSVESTCVVSVVIPTFNRREQLARTLRGLADQSFARQRFEVVVVSDGSTDDTSDYLTGPNLPLPVVALFQVNSGPAAARNHGVQIARAPLILFVDDDVVPSPDLIARHVASHDRPDDDLVVVGPMLDPPDWELSPWVRWEQRMLYKQYEAMRAGVFRPTPRQFYTGNASIAREHVLAAGGFDVSFRRAEDVELAYRLRDRGLRFTFDHDAIAYHYAERSYESWRQNAYVYGRNDVRFGRDLGQPWVLTSIGEEFRKRHGVSRLVTRLAAPRPRLRRTVSTGFRIVADLATTLNRPSVCAQALSGIYNVEYHAGVCDELGDRTEFRQILAIRPPPLLPQT